MKTNKIYNTDCLKTLFKIPDNYIDLTVFSPPYDNLRDYKGYSFDLHKIGKELYRVTKDGGIIVMVIQDATIKGRKTLTTFKTIIDWCDIGFGLFETVIYNRQGVEGAWWTKRFRVDHEYVPIFVKGKKPKHFNKESIKIPSKHGGKTITGAAVRNKDGTQKKARKVFINPMKCCGTVMNFGNSCGDGSKLKHKHPAVFPDKIPYDFINVFTQENDIVLDVMCGSGTTCLMAKILNRQYIGIEISKDYCDIANKRIKQLDTKLKKPTLYN